VKQDVQVVKAVHKDESETVEQSVPEYPEVQEHEAIPLAKTQVPP
jgi:hypothetical protein